MKTAAIALAVSIALVGCGGGGSNAPAAPPAPADLQAAPLPAIVWEPEIMMYGGPNASDDNNTWTLTINTLPGLPNPTSYDGLSANNLQITWSISQDSNPLSGAFGIENVYYLSESYILLGGSGSYTAQVTAWTPPSKLTVGDAGQLASFSDGSTETYAVTAYSPTAVLMTVTASDGSIESYTVTATGAEQLISLSEPVNGEIATFTWNP